MSWRLLSLSGSGEILTSGFKYGVCFFPVQLVGLPGALEKKISQEIGGNLNPDPLASGSLTLDHPRSGTFHEWAEPFPVAASGSHSAAFGGWGLHWFQDVSLPSSGLGFTGFLLPKGPMAQRDTKPFCG